MLGLDLEAPLPLLGVSLWNIILFLIILVIGIGIVKLVSRSIKRTLMRSRVSKILVEFTTRIIRIVLYIFVLGIALGFVGIDVGAALISISVVIGFVLGFALGDTLSNIASGFMVAITKPFKAGDYVTIAGESGEVKSVGISVTELDTPDNKRVIIPNKVVWGSNIVNFTRHRIRRVDMEVGVSYEDNLDHVIRTTTKIVKAHPKVLKNPALQVALKEMGDSSVKFVVRPWCRTEHYWDVFFELQKLLKEGYGKANISIPFPQRDIHLYEHRENDIPAPPPKE